MVNITCATFCWAISLKMPCCLVFSYMGTITGISDLDPVRWPNSHWRSVKVFMLQEHSFACCYTLHYVLLELPFRTYLAGVYPNSFYSCRLVGTSLLLGKGSQGYHFGKLSHLQHSQCIHPHSLSD